MKTPLILKASLISLVIGSIILYLAVTLGFLNDTKFDDAFMITRYAKNWLLGSGFAWNIGEGATYGVTTPLYLFLITFVLAVTGAEDATVLVVTSYTAGILAVITLVLLGFFIQRNTDSKHSLLPLLIIPVLLLIPPFRYHSLSGMETTLSLLMNSLLAFSLVFFTRKRTSTALLLSVFIGLSSFLTRPDNGLYALLLPPLFYLACDRTLLKDSVKYLALTSILIALSLICSKALFGSYLPLPFYAKKSGFYEGYIGATAWNMVELIHIFLVSITPFLLAIILTIHKKSLFQVLTIFFIIFATFCYFSTVTQIMGMQARYYYPSLPFIILAAYISIYNRPLDSLPKTNNGFEFRAVLIIALLIPITSSYIVKTATEVWGERIKNKNHAIIAKAKYKTRANTSLPEISRWQSIYSIARILEKVPENTVLAASEHGYLSSKFNKIKIFDFMGLHDPVIAKNGFDFDYLISKKVDLIWFPHNHYTGITSKIVDHPDFQRSYTYFPGAFDYGLAINKNSINHDELKKLVVSEFSQTYPNQRIDDYVAIFENHQL